jgi:glycosyltransferase involved in cell wall biosynthesis
VNPLVSIIVASYNKRQFIAETLRSVIAQTFADWELVLVDDCSTDGTIELVSTEIHDARIRIFQNNTNKGGNFCRNLGIKAARGEFVIFLDADDLLEKHCLEKRLKCRANNPSFDIWIFAMGVFYYTPGDDARLWLPKSKKILRDFLRHDLPWAIVQPLWRTSVLRSINGFDENIRYLQDVELHTRFMIEKQPKIFQHAGEPDCFYRIDPLRTDKNKAEVLGKRVESSIYFCEKFHRLVPEKNRKDLAGTLYHTYQQITYSLKNREITRQEFNSLEDQLFAFSRHLQGGAIRTSVLKLIGFYNLKLPLIPGINFFLRKILVF